jgi:hypothetical protein
MATYAGAVWHLAPMTQVKDYINGAVDPGVVIGTVKTQVNATTQVPTRCRVVLIRDMDLVAVRSMISDAVTGAYTFSEIDRHVSYTVLAYHLTSEFRAVVANGLYPA